jgi:hypothetical protein
MRSPDQAVISISLPKDLLAKIDARATALNMPRSRYFSFLARSDVDRGGALQIEPRPELGAANAMDAAREIAQFLEMAVPALADFDRRQNDPQATGSEPEAPASAAENQFWNDFLDERDQILTLKWIESEKAGLDIGYKRAIQTWLKHRPGWQAAHATAVPPVG